MIDFTIETQIERPPSEVFAYAIDPDKLPDWQTNTISATQEGNGPIRLGSRLREVHAGPRGKRINSLVEVSEFERNHIFALKMIEGSLPIDARIVFEPTEKGTLVAFTVSGQLRGPMRLAQPFLNRAFKRQFEEHCANLKRLLEGSSQG